MSILLGNAGLTMKVEQLQAEIVRLKAENARLAAVCRLGYETFEWLQPHCDVGKDRMQVALIELNKAGDSTALRDLLAPTIELLEIVYANLYGPWTVWKPKVQTELARLRAITERKQ